MRHANRRPAAPDRSAAERRSSACLDLPWTLGRPSEADIVSDHGIRSDRHPTGICQIELAKHDLVPPDFAQEILEDLDGQLLARTAAIAEAEWSKAGIVANRMACAVNHRKHRAEAAVGNVDLAAILDLEIGDVEWAACKPDLPAFVVVDLRAGGNAQIALRGERLRVLPVDRIQAGAGGRRAHIAGPLQRHAESLLRRRAVGAGARVVDHRDAAAVRRDDAEQFHDEQLQWREGRAAGRVEISAHGLLKGRPHGRVAAVFGEPRHDAENGVAPLAERHEIVEALEDDVLLAEMAAVAGILQPVPGHGLFRVFGLAGLDVADALVDPRLQQVDQLAHLHVVVVSDWQQRIAVGEDGVEGLTDLPHLEGSIVAGDTEVKVPVKVEIVIEIVPHERLVGELRIQDLVEKGGDLGPVHRLVEIGSHAGKINALAQVVFAALVQALEENRYALLGIRLPVGINEAHEIV